MQRFAFALAALLTLLACSVESPTSPASDAEPSALAMTADAIGAASATAQTTTFAFPLPQPFRRLIPCAAGGAGELVDLGGTLHLMMHTTLDGRGGFHMKVLVHPRGITGVGLTTGDVYHGTGGTHSQLNGNVGEETTRVDNFRLIGEGPENNLLMHETFHVTVDANGRVTARVSDFSVECR